MKCNILGSGSRRSLFKPDSVVSVGCNVPYAKVEYTVLFDTEIVDVLPYPIEYKLLVHKRVLSYIKNNHPHLLTKIDKVFEYSTSGYKLSSGHHAANCMIKMGYTELNLYGMDAWFDPKNWENSYTDKYITKKPGGPPEMGYAWRDGWQLMMKQNPSVKFNFI